VQRSDGIIKRTFNGDDVTLTCEFCGEPIALHNPEFGLDCKNRCQEKALRRLMEEQDG